MQGDLNSLNKFEEIISELSRIQKLPQPYRDDDDNFAFPRQLPLGNGRCIYISKKIELLIADVARKMRTATSMQRQFSPKEYLKFVRYAFAIALEPVDLDADLTTNAKQVQTDVENRVSERVDRQLRGSGREYAFGCTLFSCDDFPPFEIGPVRFEPRLIWLKRKSSDGCRVFVDKDGRIKRFDHQIADGPISKTTKRRVMRAWNNQKLKERKPSFDRENEKGVLDAIGECKYVCSVKIPPFGHESGEDKALVAARLALTTLALIWESPTTALSGLNLHFDRNMYNRYVLSFTSDGLILSGGELASKPNAPFTPFKDLHEWFEKYAGEFRLAGEAINWLLEPEKSLVRPTLSSITAQALLWFHDGCREIADLKAIVCFAACLDILACGGGQPGIRNLIQVRLGPDKNTIITRDGLTVKDVVQNIYDNGRNRFSHGPLDRDGKNVWKTHLSHDWSETRHTAERLARLCLISCLNWMVNHPNCDDPNQMQQQ